jgi:nucleotide-binding universal stress UspA family protein
VPIYTKIRQGPSISKGILDEIESHQNIKLILAGWPGPLNPHATVENPIQILLEKAQTNVAVLLSHNLGQIRNILVPIGGGPHSRLALHVAYEIAEQENAKVTAFHAFSKITDAEEIEDTMLNLRQIIVEELGLIPVRISTLIERSDSVISGILGETKRQTYDLLVLGASEEYGSGTRLFGSVDDWIVEHVENCSVLLVRQHESAMIHWIRRHLKMMGKEY